MSHVESLGYVFLNLIMTLRRDQESHVNKVWRLSEEDATGLTVDPRLVLPGLRV